MADSNPALSTPGSLVGATQSDPATPLPLVTFHTSLRLMNMTPDATPDPVLDRIVVYSPMVVFGADADYRPVDALNVPPGLDVTAVGYPASATDRPRPLGSWNPADLSRPCALLVRGFRGTVRAQLSLIPSGSDLVATYNLRWLPTTASSGR